MEYLVGYFPINLKRYSTIRKQESKDRNLNVLENITSLLYTDSYCTIIHCNTTYVNTATINLHTISNSYNLRTDHSNFLVYFYSIITIDRNFHWPATSIDSNTGQTTSHTPPYRRNKMSFRQRRTELPLRRTRNKIPIQTKKKESEIPVRPCLSSSRIANYTTIQHKRFDDRSFVISNHRFQRSRTNWKFCKGYRPSSFGKLSGN